MENQQKIESVKQKDSWKLAYKNFLHLSYFGLFLFLVALVLIITKTGPYKLLTIFGILQILLFTVGWFVLSQLFKKHNKLSIKAGYTFLVILIIFNLSSGFNLIILLIYGYLFYLVYKASKNPTQLNT